MRILLLTEVFPPQKGGSGRWMWELYRRLPVDLHIVAGQTDGADAFDTTHAFSIERLRLKQPDWGLLSVTGVTAYAQRILWFRRILRRMRPDSIHCGKTLPEGLLALLSTWPRARPICCFVHGEELQLAQTSRDLRWLTRATLSRARLVIANSDTTRRLLADDWGITRQVEVMHPGVDASTFVPAQPDEAIRGRLGWTGRRVILTVGTLQARKGQDTLIRALPAIRRACPDVLYAIAGGGADRARLEALADEHGVREAVRFVDASSDERLLHYYQQCDLFALPNRRVGWDVEGFGIVLLEAQACGKAVVAGRSGGTAETMQEGITGELVPCETPEPLAETLVRLLDDPARRRAMGKAGRAWVLDRFDWPVLERQASQLFAKWLTAAT